MLLTRPFPQKNELLPHYLMRLSAANHYHNTILLLKACGENLSNNRVTGKKVFFGEFNISHLASMVNLNVEKLEQCKLIRVSATRYQYAGQQFLLKSTAFNGLRVCPECYANCNRLDLLNSLSARTFCTRHNRCLIEVHPVTGRKLSWGTKNLAQDIEGWLIQGQTRSVSETEHQLNQILEKSWHNESSIELRGLGNLNFSSFLDLIHFFARFHHAAFSSKSSSTMTTVNQFEAAYHYLADWPNAYYELLAHFEMNPMSSIRLTGIRKCFRDLYDDLYAHDNRESAAYRLLKQQFEVYIREYFVNGALNSSLTLIPKSSRDGNKYCNDKQACQILDCAPSKLKVYVRENLLSVASTLANSTNLYSRNELLRLKTKIEHCLCLKVAAEQLGISQYHLRQFLHADVIKALICPTNNNRDWLIEGYALTNFVIRLAANAGNEGVDTAHGIKRYTFAKVDLAELISKMLDGEIKYSFKANKRKPFSLSQFKVQFEPIDNTPFEYMSPVETCAILHINKNAVYDLVKKNMLECKKLKVMRTARPIKLISRKSIEMFKAKYILKYEIQSTSLGDYKAISGPKIDGGIVNIYLRNDRTANRDISKMKFNVTI
jgi:hypothetical protein